MKTFTHIIAIVLLASLLLTSCLSSDEKPTPVKKSKLVVLLYDISKSNDKYAILKEKHLKEMFAKIAFGGGGKFYSLLIKSNSRKQEIFQYEIPAYDTITAKGNAYQMRKIRKSNAKILQSYNANKAKFINIAKTLVIKPKTENFTDINGALQIAKVTLSQNMYNDYDKTLIIISDGINDLPPVNGEDKMNSITLENVKILMVRPSKTYFIKGKNIIIANTIQEALMNL